MESMEGEFSSPTESPSEIKIRADLEEYFEVVSYAAKTLRCKLAGRNNCKMDGRMSSLTCRTSRGWYNFERHLIQVHKFPKDTFLKSKTPHGTEDVEQGRCKPPPVAPRCCFACLSKSPTDSGDHYSMNEEIMRHFPGSEGSSQLSQQLFHAFFLLNILDFPKAKCERLLRSFKGVTTPETWFFLCVACKTIVLEAFSIRQRILLLEKQLGDVKDRMKMRFQDNADSDRVEDLNKVESEIRLYVQESSKTRRTAPIDVKWPASTISSEKAPLLDMDPEFPVKIEIIDSVVYPDGSSTEDLQQLRKSKRHRSVSFMDVKEGDNEDLDKDYIPDAESDDPEFKPSQSIPIFKSKDRKRKKKVLRSIDDGGVFGIKIREDLKEYFEVVSLHAKTLRCKLAGKNECKIDGGNAALTYRSARGGWFNFQRHLMKVHKIPKETFSVRIFKDRKPKARINKVKKEIVKHENWDSSTETFVCKICPANHPTLRYFNRHMRDHDSSKERNNEYDCGECGYPCLSSKAKETHTTVKHRRREERSTQLSCSLCPVVASSKKKLVLHMREHREKSQKECINGKFHCKFCDRLFLSYALLCRHKRNVHHKEMGWAPIVCTICSGVFSTHRHLRDHVQQTHNKESRFYCDFCGRGFLYMSKLRRHLNSHARENQYVCEICGADFLYSETLRTHVKKDHPESGIVGNAGINHSNEYSNQISETSNAAKFTCKHCNAELGSSTLLSRHLKSHTELFQHKCEVCGKHYATPQSLRRHLDINHTGKKIPCQYCDKTFPHQEYVRAHFRYCKNHPDKRETVKASGEPLNMEVLCDMDADNAEGESSVPALNVVVLKSEEFNIDTLIVETLRSDDI